MNMIEVNFCGCCRVGRRRIYSPPQKKIEVSFPNFNAPL